MWAGRDDGELEGRGVTGERIEKTTWGWGGGCNVLPQEAEWPEPPAPGRRQLSQVFVYVFWCVTVCTCTCIGAQCSHTAVPTACTCSSVHWWTCLESADTCFCAWQ